MKGAVILGVIGLVALASASPLALEKPKEEKPLSVVDVPAGVFETQASDDKPQKESETEIKKEAESSNKGVENPDSDKVKPEDEEGPHVFGFRLPSILIIRRPAVFQDPFGGFDSPFFGGFNRRPIFAPRPVDTESVESQDKVKDREPLGEGSQIDEQKQNETVVNVNHLVQRMHQQINNLFANLFNPDTFAIPRPTFSRPFFSRPSFLTPFPEDSSEEKVEFDKLPANYSNSTSETKVVDGQLITVNKTVHKISGNNSNGFFHFSVINVRPNAPEQEDTKPNTEVVGSETKPEVTEKKPEMAEVDPKMNEVDRPEEAEQKLTEVELKSTYETQNEAASSNNGEEEIQIVPIKPVKLIKASPGKTYSDLSSDIRVNNLMENSQQARVRALFDPEEVEVFDV